jgi:hypothetical protein
MSLADRGIIEAIRKPQSVISRYQSSPASVKDGDPADILTDVKGRIITVSGGAAGAADQVQGNTATGAAAPTNAIYVGMQTLGGNMQGLSAINNNLDGVSGSLTLDTGLHLWNGTNFDRARTNMDTAALITAAGATTNQNSADQTNYNGRAVKVVLDVTSIGTGSVTITIQGKDIASGKYYPLLVGAAVVTNSTNVYEVGPGLSATANVSANAHLPRTWRVLVTANNANATTYTVGASVIL